MKVRRFLLENEKGQQFKMDNLDEGCFFVSPTDLGYSYKINFVRLQNSFIENNRELQQKNPKGTLYFKSYDKVKEFIDYIEGSNKIKFLYGVPFEAGEKIYYRDVAIIKLDKTEKTGIWLACPIEFASTSLWYEENTTVYTIKPVSNEIRWDFRWDSRFTDYNTRNLQHINTGHVEAPILIEFTGKVINPKIQLYVEGKLYQELKFNITINEYEKLLYCTKENEFYINKQNTDGTLEDLYDLDIIKDFEKIDEVIRLPQNKSCELRLTADNDVLNAKATIWTYYKAV